MELPLILILLSLSGFFSASESALFSLRWWRITYLRHHGGRPGKRLADLMEHPGSVLMGILLGNTVANVAASALFEHVLENNLPDHALMASIGVMSIIILVFCEITPKTIAIHRSETVSLWVAGPVKTLVRAVYPLRLFIEVISSSLARFLRKTTQGPQKPDLFALADEGLQAGILTASEHHVMTRIMHLKTRQVADVMIPRTEMIALPDTIDFDQAVQAFLQHDYNRIPLFRSSIDNIVGILYAKDLLGGWLNPVLKRSPRVLARSPVFVPSHITLKQLSQDLRERKRHLAVVLDEYGGTAGMITHDDILKSVFFIPDRSRDNPHVISHLPENEWILDARITWNQLNHIFGWQDKKVPFRTLNGFLMDHFGQVPEPGEQMTIPADPDTSAPDWQVTILTAEPIRVQTVRIRPIEHHKTDQIADENDLTNLENPSK